MSIGKISAYDVKNGSWTSYADRIEMYFIANDIKEELRLPTLVSLMGDEAYELLVNLASPRKPAELKYDEACVLLRNHLQPTPSVLAERYRFRQRRQASENISEYVAELKKLARHCKFGESLGENLRDQFICGIKSDLIRQRLFAEDDITFVGAVKLATSLEAAERDAAAVEARVVPETEAVHTVRSSARAPFGRRGSANGGGRAAVAVATQQRAASAGHYCRGCGATGHDYGDCKFRDYVCSKCKRIGHLRRVCAAGSAPGQTRRPGGTPRRDSGDRAIYYGDADAGAEHEPEDDHFIDLHQLCLRDYKAVSLPITVNEVIIPMEIDTGTAISCISKHTYDKYYKNVDISPCQLSLKFYDGSYIRPLGYIKPVVKYGREAKELELFIIDGGTTALLGRQWLSELKINLPMFNCNHNIVNKDNEINVLLNRYKELFDGSLGRFTGCEATLQVREGAVPVYHRARPMAFAQRERVDAELDTMLRAGVIEPVNCSDWASPLVPVNKADGSLRVCVDYKATLNPVLVVDRYPLPKIDDVLVALNGAKYFSKIDLSQSYNQIVLDESKKYTVINTHRGLFRYNRLVFGLSSSPGIFQRIMTNLLQGIANVAVFIDDVIIGGKTRQEHLEALDQVFERMLSNGLRLKENKCVFLVPEVSYLGYILSENGIRVDPAKIEAVVKIPRPQNTSELRSFLGLANFFAKFIRNFSKILVPLYRLLQKGVDWSWSKECEIAFQESKQLLTSPNVLAHYNPDGELILTCDASPTGVGGVITQPCGPGGRERPIAFVSRTLTSAEKNYSQIHREALAIVFCMKKFHQYLYGRKFTLRTDHKPLVSIFGPNKGIPTMTASRMQRWAIILSAYNYNIEYVKTNDNSADGLSRLPLHVKVPLSPALPEQTFLHFAQEALLLDYNELKQCTSRDPILGKVLGFIRDGWPSECEISNIQPYFNRQNELYEELGCVMWGHRVVIPDKCKIKVLNLLHEPHMGIVKSKSLARSYVWWAGIDEAVEAMCRECGVCAAHADAPPRQAPRPWSWPGRPWSRLHLDFLGPIFGKTYLVIVDAMSKWLEIFHVPSTAANWSIGKLTELWSRWGLPKQIVTDNGPPFSSSEFGSFIKDLGIEHIFTAPYHPASNGAAENAVKTLKRVIKKAVYENQDVSKALYTFLLYYRNTEHTSTGESPAMIMLGRRLRTRLDALKPDRETRVSRVQQRQVDDAGGANRNIGPGDDVWYRQYLKGEKWLPGKVECKLGPSNFKVISEGGDAQVHRHIDQLKRRRRSSLVCPNPDRSFQPNRSDLTKSLIEGEEAEISRSSDHQSKLSSPQQSEQSQSGVSSPYTSAPQTPGPTQDPCIDIRSPRPLRQCRLPKPNYKF